MVGFRQAQWLVLPTRYRRAGEPHTAFCSFSTTSTNSISTSGRRRRTAPVTSTIFGKSRDPSVPTNPKSPRTLQSGAVSPTVSRARWRRNFHSQISTIFLQWHPSDVLSKCYPAENTFSVPYKSGLGNAYPFDIADQYCRKRFRWSVRIWMIVVVMWCGVSWLMRVSNARRWPGVSFGMLLAAGLVGQPQVNTIFFYQIYNINTYIVALTPTFNDQLRNLTVSHRRIKLRLTS